MMGLSTSGNISFGWAFVAGKKRVPNPAAGNTALRTLIFMRLTSPGSQDGTVVTQHELANDFNRWKSLLQKVVVKLLQAELVPHLLLVIGAQLQDFQFAERVHEIRRVACPAQRFSFGDRLRLVAFLDEHVCR